MSILHPFALVAGTLLVGVPIAVHLLTRPRPVRLPFSAMRFLESALRQRRFFARLRDILILSMRAALVGLLAAGFARVLLRGAAEPAGGPVGRRVVLLDVSSSMNARRGGVGVMERARAQALRYLAAKSDLRANVVLAGARPRAVFDRFSANHPALQAEVRRAEAHDEALDARGALATALQLLADTAEPNAGRRQLVIITDLQETNWSALAGSARPAIPPDVDVVVEYVGLGPQAANLAVTRVTPEGRLQAGRPARVRVQVANFSGSDHARTVQLTANDRVYHADVQCRAWQSSAVTFDLPADHDGGWITGAAHLVEARDCFPSDDSRPFAFAVGDAPTLLVVSRDDAHRVGSACYYLWRALAPEACGLGPGGSGLAASGGERAAAVRTDALTYEALAAADLVALVRPGALRPDTVERLAALLRHGRPILYLVSEPADAGNLAALRAASGDALRLPVRFAAVTSAVEGARAFGVRRTALTLTDFRASVPPFREFGDDLGRLVQGVTAAGILKTAPEPNAAEDEVLARWSDGSAALVSTHVGRGRLAVWNASLTDSTLPRSAFFVACLRELVLDLLNDPLAADDALAVGTAQTLYLPAGAAGPAAAGLQLVGPAGREIAAVSVREGPDGVAWHWSAAGAPGVYRVVGRGGMVMAVATACPSAESDLRPIAVEAIEAGLASGPEAVPVEPASAGRQTAVAVLGHPDRPGSAESKETWPWFLVAAVGLIVFELAVWKLFHV